MANYYIADMHLGHANIIKHSRRPFANVDEMNKVLIDNWNHTVRDDDNVYILGDLFFSKGIDPLSALKQLKGKKYLIKGNHDRELCNTYRNYFYGIYDILEVKDNGKKIILCHYPMTEWNGFFRGALHFYGHIHNNAENAAYKIMKNVPNAYNVGADLIGYTPRTADWIIKDITEGE